jgi:hypothetical protein
MASQPTPPPPQQPDQQPDPLTQLIPTIAGHLPPTAHEWVVLIGTILAVTLGAMHYSATVNNAPAPSCPCPTNPQPPK